jgi:hypothetical protein
MAGLWIVVGFSIGRLKVGAEPIDDRRHTGAILEVREQKRPFPAHPFCVPFHHRKVGADVRRQVDLVDHQQIRPRDAGPSLARDLVASGDVNDVESQIQINS